MRDRVFVDTNLFVYAALEDQFHTEKRRRSIELLGGFGDATVLISTQILNEFYSVMLRHGIDDARIQEKLSVIIKETTVTGVKLKTVRACWKLKTVYGYSYWDSLVLASALENSCSIVYTEDMQHGQLIEKALTITNPFER
jgi:predicted nucleic acid-binding protein